MDTLLQDLRYAIRVLIKKPAFTAVAVLALALGIGATSAIFSVVHAVLLRPLPYQDSDRLVLIWTDFGPDLPQNWVSGPELLDFRQRCTSFEGFTAMAWPSVALTGAGEPEQVQGAVVSANFFSLLGVQSALGHAFDEDGPASEKVVVLSHGFWQRRFASDPSIIGKPLSLDGETRTVIGVMPAGFGVLPPDAQSPKNIEIWAPIPFDYAQLNRGSHFLRVIARLKPGVTIGQAKAEMSTIAKAMDKEFYHSFGFGITVVPLLGHVVKDVKPALLVLLGAVGFVLLIACANVANLLLARAVTREREIALRQALGALPFRLIRQLLTESVVLAALGGAAGLLLAFAGLRALIAMAPEDIPRLNEIRIDPTVLGFTIAVSLVTGLVFGVVPALQASKTDPNQSLKEGGRGAGGSLRGHLARNLLVVAEVALALVLLTGAGLLIRSFFELQKVDPGFNPANVLTMRLSLPDTTYPEGPQIEAFFQKALERIESLPGVEAAGAVSDLPLSGSYSSGTITIENPLADADNASFEADRRSVSTDYFRAMGIALRRGRYFNDLDKADGPEAVIADEELAERFWPGEDPIGRRIKLGGPQSTSPWRTIVGIVAHVKDYDLSKEGREHVYFPHSQRATNSMFLTVRTAGDPMNLAGAVRNELRAVDPNQPVYEIAPMEQLVYASVGEPRFYMTLLGIFAAVALILAMVGVYGVMNYSVAQRTHEIGIRMALGAERADIIKLVVRQGLILASAGIVIGLVSSIVLTRLMESLLYEVSATDPFTFVAVALALALVAVIANLIPARRATKVDPMVALRYE
ncbi:MAG: ABC transporter permease [Blastocatellia bacterium]|nr:ABC transporter permease [Blastocatellia bacterium]